MKLALTFDDIQIVPSFSNINTRQLVNITTKFTRRYGLLVPLVSSPMDTVTEYEMAIRMAQLGGVGVIHRFMSIEDQCKNVGLVHSQMSVDLYENWGVMYDDWHAEIRDIPIAAAVGVTGDYVERAQELIKYGCTVLVIDVANGYTQLMKNCISTLKNIIPDHVDIVAGNVATYQGAEALEEWGADAIRVGIGNGSLCETRIKTGIGVPQVTALLDCSSKIDIPIISDGGVKNPGDIAKAIACGADTIMLGSLFAGTKETPGEIQKIGKWPNEELFKKYRGSASLETKRAHNLEEKNVEGTSQTMPYKGKVKRIVYDIVDGLKSSMSYTGVVDIKTFQANAELIQVTQNGYIESTAHGLLK